MKEFSFYKNIIKRPLDFLLALVAFIIFSPFLLITAVMVRVKLGSPVLFKQERPGLNERIFTLYKFRTMKDLRDEKGELLKDKDRLTPFGKALRASSLDELPELMNIIKGDMSIVGPRPLLTVYLPLYNEEQKKRHLVRPGLTGLAQVMGRNALTWNEKFALDIEYVNHITFLKDVKIIGKTVKQVFLKDGINMSEEEPMEEFKGSRSV
ncbi:MAG: sugar transferase [Anaerovoracaceae bacterium]|nr:sugar transferase [Clostridiales bacterium]